MTDNHAQTKSRMEKSLESMQSELNRLHTGRVTASLIDHIKVNCYDNSSMPLNQVASIVVENANTLNVTPWDKSLVSGIEKALMQANLGLSPNVAGEVIRVTVPPLSMERRQALISVVREIGERACVAVRNIRRDANREIKAQLKEKSISEDDQKRAESQIQKITDEFIAKINKQLKSKEDELMTV